MLPQRLDALDQRRAQSILPCPRFTLRPSVVQESLPVIHRLRLSPALLLPKLRSHFAEFLNNTSPAGLRILSSSTCVGLRYGPLLHDSGFSRQEGAAASLLHFAPHHAFVSCRADFPTLRLLRLHRAFPSRLCFPSRVPAVLITRGAGILNLLSIGYASLPLLRPRLTQSRSALLWKPWIFGRKDSHLALATHSGILSS